MVIVFKIVVAAEAWDTATCRLREGYRCELLHAIALARDKLEHKLIQCAGPDFLSRSGPAH